MSAMSKDLGDIKTFLKHKSPDKLTELMLANNVKSKKYHDYVIIFDGTSWFAWYEIDINEYIDRNRTDGRNGKG